MWPCGKDLIQQTRTWCEFQCFSGAIPQLLQLPLADPFFSILSTWAYLSDSTPQLSLKLVILKIQGIQSLCSFLGLTKEGGCLTSSEVGEYGEEGAQDPGGASM